MPGIQHLAKPFDPLTPPMQAVVPDSVKPFRSSDLGDNYKRWKNVASLATAAGALCLGAAVFFFGLYERERSKNHVEVAMVQVNWDGDVMRTQIGDRYQNTPLDVKRDIENLIFAMRRVGADESMQHDILKPVPYFLSPTASEHMKAYIKEHPYEKFFEQKFQRYVYEMRSWQPPGQDKTWIVEWKERLKNLSAEPQGPEVRVSATVWMAPNPTCSGDYLSFNPRCNIVNDFEWKNVASR
jgi:type IV secretory pathway TrbF-like protein